MRDEDPVAAVRVRDIQRAVIGDFHDREERSDGARLSGGGKERRVVERSDARKRRMSDGDAHLIAVGTRTLETEVNRTVMLIDGDVAGSVAADRRENRGTVSEAAVIGTIDVELRTHLQSGELAIREIDRVATEKLHPVAIVFRNGEVRIGIAIEVLATIEGALRGDVGEYETR